MPRAPALAAQFALPLDWSAAGANDLPLIVGPSNAEAVRYLAHVALWPVRTAVLTGPPKSGRSLIGRLFARTSGGRVVDGPDSLDEAALFHAWNAAQASGIPLLIIADTAPGHWAISLPDLASRLRAVPVLCLGDPDDALAQQLIEALFAQRGMLVAPDVAAFIVRRLHRSHAAILDAVNVLDAATLAGGRAVTKRLARDTLVASGLFQPDLIDRASAPTEPDL